MKLECKEILEIINSWLIKKSEKGDVKGQGWNNALLNIKAWILDKIEEDLK